MNSNKRYDRQMVLPEIGPAGQSRLSAARVLVIGAGGLGCPALLYLAGAGIGTISIIDFDCVDVSNLQRQVLFTTCDQGKPKATTAAARLQALNPEITIKAYDEELTDQNIISLFSGYDIIVDGTDNFATKLLINDAAVKLGKPFVYGAIQGFEGRISVFNHAKGPCYRCIYPHPPQAQIMNCAQAGVIGALAGIVGTAQAMEVIKLIVQHETFESLRGKLWMINARTMETKTLSLHKDINCPVCSRPPEDIIPQYASPVCMANTVVEIDCNETLPNNAVFIDVREREEWECGHIENAQHMPLSALQKNPEIFIIPKEKSTFVLYCQKGARSKKAAEILLQIGVNDVYSLKGGYEAWQDLNR